MSSPLTAASDFIPDYKHLGGSSAASASDGDLDGDLDLDIDRSFSSAPTDEDIEREQIKPHTAKEKEKEKARKSTPPDTPALSAPVLSALQLFDHLRHPAHCPRRIPSPSPSHEEEEEEQQDAEIQQIDISRKDYGLLLWLLGVKEEEEEEEEEEAAGLACEAEQLTHGSQLPQHPPKSAYLPLLWQGGLGLSSVQELHDLGRWVLDSVRYEFGTVWDTARPGQTKTRLSVRMPLYIHDKFALDVGQLLRDSIKSQLPGKDVHAHNGFKCRFTDKFYRIMAQRRAGRTNTLGKDKDKDKETTGATQSEQPQEEIRSGSQPAVTRTRRPQTRSRSRSQGPSHSQPMLLGLGQSQRRPRQPSGAGPPTADGLDGEEDAEQTRYDEANPDVCIYIGDEDTTLIPSVIVEIGFSHPLPSDRARSYIYGSNGQCRAVICLDIEYRDQSARHQSYQQMLENSVPEQGVEPRPPPYGLKLNLFRCKIETAAQHDTYAPTHELRDVDVRELARLDKALELRTADLVDLDDDDDDNSAAENGEQQHDGQAEGLVAVPYASIVKLLDKVAWAQALRDDPSLQPSKKRKRELVARSFTTSPEPDEDGEGRATTKKQRRTKGIRK